MENWAHWCQKGSTLHIQPHVGHSVCKGGILGSGVVQLNQPNVMPKKLRSDNIHLRGPPFQPELGNSHKSKTPCTHNYLKISNSDILLNWFYYHDYCITAATTDYSSLHTIFNTADYRITTPAAWSLAAVGCSDTSICQISAKYRPKSPNIGLNHLPSLHCTSFGRQRSRNMY